MSNIHIPKPWEFKNLRITDESIYNDRRNFIKQLTALGMGALAGPSLLANNQEVVPPQDITAPSFRFKGMKKMYPAKRNERYKVSLDRPMSEEYDATHRNNFYEFINPQDPNIYNVYKYIGPFNTNKWTFEVAGLADNTGTFRLEDIMKKFPLEERVYRFRCVERWAMVVPWTGIPLATVLKHFKPKNSAKYVKFTTASRKDEMVGVEKQTWYPWPYYEGLRMDEAMNELAFLATGIYGKKLPKQNGAPMRLIVPWKYGYKNIKSIVKIEFMDKQPATFWNTLTPNEYPFISNVDPEKPHPRWSQKVEYLIPNVEDVRLTDKYNGYGEFVAGLYE